MTIALLAAILLLPLQDPAPAWEPAVSVAKPSAMVLPWHLYEADGAVCLLTFGQSERERQEFTLVLHRRKESGTFETVWTRPLGRLEGPPATVLHDGKLVLVYPGENRAPTSRSIDLASGEASEAKAMAIDGLDKLEDDVWPTLIRHEERLLFLGAEQSRNVLRLLRSDDGGQTWVAAKEWRYQRKDGTRPLLFALGGMLHVLFHSAGQEAGDEAGLAHLASVDAGASWESRALDLDVRADQTFPMAVEARKNRACVILAELNEDRAGTLHAATSQDGGKTWQLGGKLLATGIIDMSTFCHLTGAGTRLVFAGVHVDPKEGRDSARFVCLASDDSGSTWRDLQAGRGTGGCSVLGLAAFAADGSLLAALVDGENAREINRQCEILFSRLPMAKAK